MQRVGGRRRDLRVDPGWTQPQLALQARVDMKTIWRIEHNEDISLESLRRVAAALKLPLKKLMLTPEGGDPVAVEGLRSPMDRGELRLEPGRHRRRARAGRGRAGGGGQRGARP